MKLKRNPPRMNAPTIPTIPHHHFFNRSGQRPKPPVSKQKQEQLVILGLNPDNPLQGSESVSKGFWVATRNGKLVRGKVK